MICGNENAQIIIKEYFENIKKGKIPYNFILLEGAQNIGKTTLIKKLSKELLGQHYNTDFLYLADLSSYIAKKHTIKIQVDQNEQSIKIDNIGSFLDLGTRDIIEWLYKSSIGNHKIVLLENIERMTPSAANSFLKTFEEPLKNRIIFATTQNRNILLDTITSRAFIIRFDIPAYDVTKNCLKNSFPDINESDIDLAVSFSMGRIGFAIRLLEGGIGEENGTFGDIIGAFEKFIKLFEKDGMLNEKLNILNKIQKDGLLEIFFDALIFHFSRKNRFDLINKIFKTKKYLNANVGVENSLFEMIL